MNCKVTTVWDKSETIVMVPNTKLWLEYSTSPGLTPTSSKFTKIGACNITNY